MKRSIILNLVLCVAACGLFSACIGEKANPYANEAVPELTIATEATAFSMDKAELKLNLSHFIHKDVIVAFDVDGVDRNALDLPEAYTFQAGSVKHTLPVNVSSVDLTPGAYTVVITPKEVQNATLVSSPISLSLNVEDVAFVTLAMTEFDEETHTSEVTITLSRAVTKDVVLPIRIGANPSSGMTAFPESAVTFEKRITIPAGERVAKTSVTLNLGDVESGTYEFVYDISDYGTNARPGTVSELRAVVRAGLSLKRHEWYDTYWDFSTDYNRFYTYGGLGEGIKRVTVIILFQGELDITDEAALKEKVALIGDTLTDSNTYVAPATESDYIWFPKSLAPQGPGYYYFLMLGLDAKNRPTGDYDYFSYKVDLPSVTAKNWNWGYYYGWYYLYNTGFTEKFFSVAEAPKSSGDGGEEFIADQILKAAGRVKATGERLYDDDFGGDTYKYFDTPWADPGEYYVILYGLDENLFPTGNYRMKTFTITAD